jgi:hypothetical protein
VARQKTGGLMSRIRAIYKAGCPADFQEKFSRRQSKIVFAVLLFSIKLVTARVVKLVDTQVSEACGRKAVLVQVQSRAHK